MIDVVMCLIIFFLIVGKLASDASSIRLPNSAVGSPGASRAAIVISVARGDTPGTAAPARWGGVLARVFVDGVSVAGEAELADVIATRARAASPQTPSSSDVSQSPPRAPSVAISVRADKDLPWAALEPIMRAAARAGFPGVRLATQREGDTGGTP